MSISGEKRGVVVSVRDLCTYFYTEEGEIRAVDGVSFDLIEGRTLAIVGESGCGKSVTAFSLMRLIQPPGKITRGEIRWHGAGESFDVVTIGDTSPQLKAVRGKHMGMIFQDALAALSPVHTVGNQLIESLTTHQRVTSEEATARAISILEQVGLNQPAVRMGQYPHELSGGMRQRVMIAMALITGPAVLIADEPTTALDVTIQLQVLDLIKDLQRDRNSAVLLITHDLGVVAHSADDVVVMYLGRVVERGDVRTLLKRPRHPYTVGLLESLPGRVTAQARLPSIEGSVPALSEVPAGCPFHPRCPHALAGTCDVGSPPPLVAVNDDARHHEAACLRLEQTAPPKGEAG